ncbi:MAG: SDR family NAD(P)-dependent oxidoreductase, partial [Coriobacteriia bacterium]|nr:SDR family NAD(P)-dependent oxidoreductase [Coriobacteriia bacterium]
MRRLERRVALVTGGSRGIGAAIAVRLAAEGAAVAINYAGNEAAAAEVVDAIEASGGTAASFRADVSDPAACGVLVDAVLQRFERLDILINNA